MKDHYIFTQNTEAYENDWDWDKTFYEGAIDIIEEFDTYEEALEAFDEGGYDTDLYGVF